jgi:DNA replication licensing factor MCM6
MDVIIRNEMVETVRPGDKVVFVGSLIVIPDMAAFSVPGERTLLQSKGAPSSAHPGKGVSGIATVGARELHYKLAFLASNVQVTRPTYAHLLALGQVRHAAAYILLHQRDP